MKLFIVTIHVAIGTGADWRWVDSLWVKQQHALERVTAIEEEWSRQGRLNKNEYAAQCVWWSGATVTDAALGDK